MRFLYRDSCFTPTREIQKIVHQLTGYLSELKRAIGDPLYLLPEAALHLPSDATILVSAEKLKRAKVGKKLKYLIVVGIGGSNLGAKAIYDALQGAFEVLKPAQYPKMIFADTCDEEFLKDLQKLIEAQIRRPDEVLVNVISKSGSTMETAQNAERIRSMLRKRFRSTDERFVVTTDTGSSLWKWAQKLRMACLPMPAQIGGRYSIFSLVGIFPLVCMGFDVSSLIKGAREMTKQCLKQGMSNPAFLSAAIAFWQFKHGQIIHNHFFFHPELESVGKWVRQLQAETLGKEHDVRGRVVHTGLMPIVSIGSTDLHSMSQLYLGGPRNIFTSFAVTPRMGKIMDAIFRGVKIAYQKQHLPFVEILLPDLSPRSLGAFMQWKMIETMCLAKLMNVNAFDQPAVELYKKETRAILRRK